MEEKKLDSSTIEYIEETKTIGYSYEIILYFNVNLLCVGGVCR